MLAIVWKAALILMELFVILALVFLTLGVVLTIKDIVEDELAKYNNRKKK